MPKGVDYASRDEVVLFFWEKYVFSLRCVLSTPIEILPKKIKIRFFFLKQKGEMTRVHKVYVVIDIENLPFQDEVAD